MYTESPNSHSRYYFTYWDIRLTSPHKIPIISNVMTVLSYHKAFQDQLYRPSTTHLHRLINKHLSRLAVLLCPILYGMIHFSWNNGFLQIYTFHWYRDRSEGYGWLYWLRPIAIIDIHHIRLNRWYACYPVAYLLLIYMRKLACILCLICDYFVHTSYAAFSRHGVSTYLIPPLQVMKMYLYSSHEVEWQWWLPSLLIK